MKSLLYSFLISFVICNISLAQKWGASTSGGFRNEVFDLEIDNLGNTYVVGYISGLTSFEQNTILSNVQGPEDAYIAKYNSQGEIIWAKSFGGLNADRAFEIALDNNGDLLVAGQFFGQVNIGAFTLNSSGNSKDIFLVKYSPSGAVLWARSDGGSNEEVILGLSTDNQNNIIMSGQFRGQSTIAGQTFNSFIDPNTNLPSFDLFLSKYSSTGAALWAIAGQGKYENKAMAVVTDNQDQIYICGQFSDTLFFNNLNLNQTGYSLGFISKINPQGQVQWINQMKAISVSANDLILGSNGDISVAVEFKGLLQYKDNSGFHSVSNPYTNKVASLKTNKNGGFLWGKAIGSENSLKVNRIGIDATENQYLIGNFTCDLSEFHQGSTTKFNSVGFNDAYLWRVNNSGSTDYIKQFGGKGEDFAYGIKVSIPNEPTICGSYVQDLNIPKGSATFSVTSTDHSLYQQTQGNYTYVFNKGDNSANSFVNTALYSGTPGYDFFFGAPGVSDSLQGVINLGADTLYFCQFQNLQYNSKTFPVGPDYNYSWSTGASTKSILATSPGTYFVHVERQDGCSSGGDTVELIQNPIPPLPTMSDNLNLAINEPGPLYYAYKLCYTDTLEIWFNGLDPTHTISIAGPNSTLFTDTLPHVYQEEGGYLVEVSNGTCNNSGTFSIDWDYPYIEDIKPYLLLEDNIDYNDSLAICKDTPVKIFLKDSLNNPNGDYSIDPNVAVESYTWSSITPGLSINSSDTFECSVTPSSTGWYTITYEAVFGYDNLCGTDTFVKTITKDFYFEIYPLPTATTIVNGPNKICPGDSIFLTLSDTLPGFLWVGPGIVWTSSNNDSILLIGPGFYSYRGTIIDSVTGCSKFFNFGKFISMKTPPIIQANPANGVICPNDSVKMEINDIFNSYNWLGPTGDSLSLTHEYYGQLQGLYYVQVTDADGCELNSPPFELQEYFTPYISVSPANAICKGAPVDLTANVIDGSVINWINPAAGNTPTVTATQPGTYICEMTGCGITVIDTMVIVNGDFSISLNIQDSIICFGDSTLLSTATGHSSYMWSNGDTTLTSTYISEQGFYWVTVVNNVGCEAQSDTLYVDIYEGSQPPAIPDTFLCEGADLTLSIGGLPVLWHLMDTTYLSTANSYTFSGIYSDTSFMATYEIPECPHNYTDIDVQYHKQIPPPSIFGPDELCYNDTILLYTQDLENSFEWKVSGQTIGVNDSINVSGPNFDNTNTIDLYVFNNCFSDSIKKTFIILFPDTINIVEDSLTKCYHSELSLSLTETQNIVVWTGYFGIDTIQNLNLQPELQSGFIYAQAIDGNGCRTNKDSTYLFVQKEGYNFDADTILACNGDLVNISVNSIMDSIIWVTPTGIIQINDFEVLASNTSAGYYEVNLWDSLGCYYIDTILLVNNPVPSSSMSDQVIICTGAYLKKPQNGDSLIYEWASAPNEDSIAIYSSSFVNYYVINEFGCFHEDSIKVDLTQCSGKVPNVFTPNGDGVNDVLYIHDALLYPNNTFILLNRWGQVVFKEHGYKNTFTGGDLNDHVYFYLYYRLGEAFPETMEQGFIHLVR